MAQGGAGVVVTFVARGERYVLTGKESVYVSDSVQQVELEGQTRTIAELQTGKADKKQSRLDFINRARRLSAALKYRVQFSQPTEVGGIWTTTYRRLPDAPKYGIPKGRREGQEALLATAQREVGEEVGIQLNQLNEFPVAGIPYAIFRADIAERDAQGIFQRIQERMDQHYGELFEIRFRPIGSVLAGDTNMITRRTLEALQAQAVPGGKRLKLNHNRVLTRRSRSRRLQRRLTNLLRRRRSATLRR